MVGVVVSGEASGVLEEYRPSVRAPFRVEGRAVQDDAVDSVNNGGAFVLVANLNEGECPACINLHQFVVGEGFFDLGVEVLPTEVV